MAHPSRLPAVLSSRTFAVFIFSVLAAILVAGGRVFYVERVNRGREAEAQTCAKLLGLAVIQYAQEHKNRYPDAGRWEQELAPYISLNSLPGEDIIHPTPPMGGTPRRFSLNPALSGKSMTQIASPANIWMFYESVSRSPSASDDLDHWPVREHDGDDSSAVAYGDGHVYMRWPDWRQGAKQHLPGY